MGTIEYIAPEQLNSEHLDGKADQFSLAASAYRMMSGSTLFGQHSFATLAYKIAHETPAPATSRNAALPAAVDGVLAKALSREPAQRFASCGQFVEALEVAFAENIPVDEEVTRIAPVVKESERRWYAAKGLATHAASLARSSIAVGPFVLGLVKRSAMIFGSHGLWRRTRLAILAAVILGGGALILSRPWLTGKSAQKPAMQAYNRALELADHGREEDALPFLNKAIAIRPNFPEALMDRGRILCLRLHQEETAIKDFSEVIHLEPEYAWAYYRRGECYALVERYDLALADYNRALQLEPANHFFLVGRGIVFLRQKDYQKAITDFTEAIRIDPYGGLAYQKRSEAKKAVGDAAGAMADIDKAVELMTQQPPPADRR
jgi:tetratricopeptide (TPR) repeat protein